MGVSGFVLLFSRAEEVDDDGGGAVVKWSTREARRTKEERNEGTENRAFCVFCVSSAALFSQRPLTLWVKTAFNTITVKKG